MRRFFTLCILLCAVSVVITAQTNLALTAVASASASSSGSYGPSNWNDGLIGPAYYFGWLGTDPTSFPTPWIQFEWPSPVTCNSLILHPPTWNTPSFVLFYGAAQVQYWDGSSWQSHQNFLSLNPYLPDTINFAQVTTTRLRIANFNVSGQHNPGWDEIEVYNILQPRVDLYISSVISPPDTLWSSVNYPVRFMIKNNGIDPAQNFLVGYHIGNQSATASYTNSLAPGDSVDFLFQGQLNTSLFTDPLVACKFFVYSAADTNHSNDTLFSTRLMFTVGIAATQGENIMLIRPNPFSGLLWVDSPDDGWQELKVFDMQGRLNRFVPVGRSGESVVFDLSSLPPGLYFVAKGEKAVKAIKIE